MRRRGMLSALEEAVAHNCRSIAFCAISTGVYCYPLVPATRIALSTVCDWLVEHESDMLVKFCCYGSYEYDVYREVAEELGIC